MHLLFALVWLFLENNSENVCLMWTACGLQQANRVGTGSAMCQKCFTARELCSSSVLLDIKIIRKNNNSM